MPFCPECATKNEEGARFCLKCGAALGPSPPAPSVGQMSRLLPFGGIIIAAIIMIMAIALWASFSGGGDSVVGGTPTETVEKFLEAINRGDFDRAQTYLARGRVIDDNYVLVPYVGKIDQVAILNERIKVGPVTGAKTAYLHAIINPPPELPLRGDVSTEGDKEGDIYVADEETGGPIGIIPEQSYTSGGLPIARLPEIFGNQFFFILRWENGKWRISSP
ncbi:MAG: hypothetical protein DDT18_00562 [Actinobacteria bacterium]|nr:hypothetical protein [Actinomycetota bacterium]